MNIQTVYYSLFYWTAGYKNHSNFSAVIDIDQDILKQLKTEISWQESHGQLKNLGILGNIIYSAYYIDQDARVIQLINNAEKVLKRY